MNWPTLASKLTLANGERPLMKACPEGAREHYTFQMDRKDYRNSPFRKCPHCGVVGYGTGFVAVAPDVGALLVALTAAEMDHQLRSLRGRYFATIYVYGLPDINSEGATPLDALMNAVAMALEAK